MKVQLNVGVAWSTLFVCWMQLIWKLNFRYELFFHCLPALEYPVKMNETCFFVKAQFDGFSGFYVFLVIRLISVRSTPF